MNALQRFIWIGLLLSGSSCNRFVDQQPTPDNGPPASAIQALTQVYPQARDIRFATLAANQLWQATFAQQERHFQALVDPRRLVMADKLVEGVVVDSLTRLLEATVVTGGTFGSPRLRQYNGWFGNPVISESEIYLYADYSWQQQLYTARWSLTPPVSGRVIYNLELLPYQQADYQTQMLTDLPESIQAALRQQDLVFTQALIQVGSSGKRRYTLSVQQLSAPPGDQFWQLSYSDDGQLLAATNQATATFFQQIEQLPPPIQDYLRRPELAGFVLSRGGYYGFTSRHTYGSLSTYQISLQKDNQAWGLLFSKEGQLIRRSFLTYGTL